MGVASTGELMVAAGEKPDQLRSEESFAMLCGACPLSAARLCEPDLRPRVGPPVGAPPPCALICRPATKVTPGRIGKKGILTQLDQDTARRLKMLAVERDTTPPGAGRGGFQRAPPALRPLKGGPNP